MAAGPGDEDYLPPFARREVRPLIERHVRIGGASAGGLEREECRDEKAAPQIGARIEEAYRFGHRD
jgi:hypothetical protein